MPLNEEKPDGRLQHQQHIQRVQQLPTGEASKAGGTDATRRGKYREPTTAHRTDTTLGAQQVEWHHSHNGAQH